MKFRLFTVSLLVLSLFVTSCGSKSTTKENPVKDTTEKIVDTVVPNQQHVDTISTTGNVEAEFDDGIIIDPNASPENVVKTIIKAAKTGKYGPLQKICNEAIDMDGDAKDICNIGNGKEGNQKEFKDYFGNAKIVGKARINKGIGEVDIETTAEGGSKETIIVQIKYDKWYLKGL